MSSLRDELLAIRAAHGGVLTPAIVRDAARGNSHPLHHRFEWDDSVAGEAYRLQQAHKLIQSVRISFLTPDGTERDIRGFHAIRSETAIVYETAEEIAEDPIKTQLLLNEYEREWRDLKRRWEYLPQFWTTIREEMPATIYDVSE